MIKFFRKIRRNLLKENKFSKYLLYAIGEIVLVIIGILIALGINENAKNRNNLELRDLYIIQLNDEVERNINRLNEYKVSTVEMIKDIDTLVQLLAIKDYDNPKIASKSIILITANTFHSISLTYENLKSSGDLKLFDDLKLRNSISKPYESFQDIYLTESLDEKSILVYAENYLMPNVSFWDMTKNSKTYAKTIFYQNMVLSRSSTLRQVRDSYSNSIESLEELKGIFAELQNDN